MVSLLCAPLLLLAQEPESALQAPAALTSVSGRVQQPVELGQVRWGRDLEAGLMESKASGKPVLLLFQEVPG